MLAQLEIRLALSADSSAIAELSRDCIEQGLRWSWTPERIRRSIRDRATNGVVVTGEKGIVGFAIMRYGDEEAHLDLFAVAPKYRRRGIGSALLAWLEVTARTAGVSAIRLQVRATNSGAIEFYRKFGFREAGLDRRYYQGVEDALLMAKDTTPED
jgi:ribosomal-protein-alanine N-acetyltransferase